MTTEIAVFNRYGLAMAADSAATVEHLHNNKAQQKVHNTANKLFTLSKYAPVGIVVYNAAAIGGIPWETIIKSYRRSLGAQRFDYLREYAASFFDWLNSNQDIFDHQMIAVIISGSCSSAISSIAASAKTEDELQNKIRKKIASLSKQPFLEGFNENTLAEIKAAYGGLFVTIADDTINKSYQTFDRGIVAEFLALSLVKKGQFEGYSGIVFGGFGEKEYLPSLIEYRTDIVVLNKPRAWQVKTYTLSASENSQIVPFADKEVIETLINGINPKFQSEASRGAFQLIVSMPMQIIGSIVELNEQQKAKYIGAAVQQLPGLFGHFAGLMDKYRKETHYDPIKKAISSLPISDLGLVAETLLSVAQIHKKINPGLETVGGPVDVAVISKGDGFVWIKRKHYFDMSLNPSFLHKYFET